MNILEFLIFGWKYTGVLLTKRQNEKTPINTLNYVVHENTRDWILGAKARRLSRYSNKKSDVFYSSKFDDLNVVDGYFFLHPNVYSKSLSNNKWLVNKKCIVMFTHPEFKNNFSVKHRVFVLNTAHKVIFLNKEHADLMIKYGLDRKKVEIMHLASDANLFSYHERNKGKVCMSMAYYPRKNPELLLDIVTGMPHRNFMLIGKGWEAFPKWDVLVNAKNFEYQEFPDYKDYPKLYEQCDVFLSTSMLEGGPVPLLETMLCNMVPVASKTGYCTDIIVHGENGYLFDLNANAKKVMPLIDQAFELKENVRNSVIDFTWEKYSSKIDTLFNLKLNI